MENDKLKGLFLLWGLILFIELFWLQVTIGNSIADVLFVMTVIGVTCVFGSVGFFLFKDQ